MVRLRRPTKPSETGVHQLKQVLGLNFCDVEFTSFLSGQLICFASLSAGSEMIGITPWEWTHGFSVCDLSAVVTCNRPGSHCFLEVNMLGRGSAHPSHICSIVYTPQFAHNHLWLVNEKNELRK